MNIRELNKAILRVEKLSEPKAREFWATYRRASKQSAIDYFGGIHKMGDKILQGLAGLALDVAIKKSVNIDAGARRWVTGDIKLRKEALVDLVQRYHGHWVDGVGYVDG